MCTLIIDVGCFNHEGIVWTGIWWMKVKALLYSIFNMMFGLYKRLV